MVAVDGCRLTLSHLTARWRTDARTRRYAPLLAPFNADVRREGHDGLGELRTLVRWYLLEYNRPRTMALSPRLYDPRVSVRFRVAHRLQNAGRNIEECRTLGLRLQGSS